MALEPGGADSKIINAIGMGLMVGFRRTEKETQSFNIGAGLIIDPDTTVLGDGITINRPLPTGETEVRLKNVSQAGWFILTSFSF